jgi:hypothetical protein
VSRICIYYVNLSLSPGCGYKYWALLVLSSNHAAPVLLPPRWDTVQKVMAKFTSFFINISTLRERHCQNPQGISCTRDPWITKHKLHSSTWMILMFFPALHWQTQITDFAQNHWKPSLFRVLAVNSSVYIGNVLVSWKMHELLINEAFCLHLHIHKGVVE